MNIEDIVPELFSSDCEKRVYYCQRCLNHGARLKRKNHKAVCQYRHCPCSDCQMVDRRRELNSRLLQMDGSSSSTSSGASSDGCTLDSVLNLSFHHDEGSVSPPASTVPHLQFGSSECGGKMKERRPNCQRCAQHNVVNRLKGHKRSCPFKECLCAKCQVVVERQRLMADQIKLRRRQKKEKQMMQELPTTVSPPPIHDHPSVCLKCTQQAIGYQSLLSLLDPNTIVDPIVTLTAVLQNCTHRE